jgi:hypothetical protein
MIALPAIPPLFAFASMAIGLVVFFYSPEMWQQYVSLFVASFAILALMLITAKRQSKMGDAARINVTRTSS